jgi:hypothetical protein
MGRYESVRASSSLNDTSGLHFVTTLGFNCVFEFGKRIYWILYLMRVFQLVKYWQLLADKNIIYSSEVESDDDPGINNALDVPKKYLEIVGCG